MYPEERIALGHLHDGDHSGCGCGKGAKLVAAEGSTFRMVPILL